MRTRLARLPTLDVCVDGQLLLSRVRAQLQTLLSAAPAEVVVRLLPDPKRAGSVLTVADVLGAVEETLRSRPVRCLVAVADAALLLPHLAPVARRIAASPVFFKVVYVPIYAGSNQVLHEMDLSYDRDDVLTLVSMMRQHGVAVATRLHVAFPTESHVDFTMTLDLINMCNFAEIETDVFKPEADSRAARLRQLPADVVRQRFLVACALVQQLAREKIAPGTDIPCLIVRADDGSLLGRSDRFRDVHLPPGRVSDADVGRTVHVKVASDDGGLRPIKALPVAKAAASRMASMLPETAAMQAAATVVLVAGLAAAAALAARVVRARPS